MFLFPFIVLIAAIHKLQTIPKNNNATTAIVATDKSAMVNDEYSTIVRAIAFDM
jgi:hypothetical protein